jgi:3-mercaptopyruvate sulfurtransferase SseA
MNMRARVQLALVVAAAVCAGAVGAARAGQAANPGRIAFEPFKKLWDRDAVLTIDVRDAGSYRSGHIPGAISVPLGELASKVDDLKKEKRPIVTYCA